MLSFYCVPIVEKFETISRIDEYLKDVSLLFVFSDLIDKITPESNISVLLDEKSNWQKNRSTELLPYRKKFNTPDDLNQEKSKLEGDLVIMKRALVKKAETLTLEEKFNDNTLKNYFKLTEVTGGYSIDAYIGFDDETVLIPKQYLGVPIVNLAESIFENSTNLVHLTIQAEIERIPYYFCKKSSITTVSLPNSVVQIGAYAFQSSNLRFINLGTNVAEIFMGAFSNTNITTVQLPDSLKVILQDAFCNTLLNQIEIPPGVEILKSGLVSGCQNLHKITLHEGLKEIEGGVFSTSNVNPQNFYNPINEKCNFNSKSCI